MQLMELAPDVCPACRFPYSAGFIHGIEPGIGIGIGIGLQDAGAVAQMGLWMNALRSSV